MFYNIKKLPDCFLFITYNMMSKLYDPDLDDNISDLGDTLRLLSENHCHIVLSQS